MRRFLFLCGLCLLFASCNTEVTKPDNLISRGKMKSILTDIYIYRQTSKVNPKKNLNNFDTTNLAILQKHKVSRDQFKSSYAFYVIDEKAYDELLVEIKDSIQQLLPKDYDLKDHSKKDRLKASKKLLKKAPNKQSDERMKE